MALHINDFIQITNDQGPFDFAYSEIAKEMVLPDADLDPAKILYPAITIGDMQILVDKEYRKIAEDLIHHFWEGEMLTEEIGDKLSDYNFTKYESIKFDYPVAKWKFKEALIVNQLHMAYDYPEAPFARSYLLALGINAALHWI
ncbi:MAG: hypothetical protein MJ155_01085 [Candidatus Saccharibacteria bacterium]|nr:hypothetical protein [Candidatus Saccharibacteria bacterium]